MIHILLYYIDILIIIKGVTGQNLDFGDFKSIASNLSDFMVETVPHQINHVFMCRLGAKHVMAP